MVAILLSVVLGDLILADQFVDRAVYVGWIDTETRGGLAVDGQIDREALRLLIGTDVREIRRILQGGKQLRRPGV
jgi:hypothetical protein